MTTHAAAWPSFAIPDAQVAHCPPEARGLRRDEVRMLVQDGGIRHATFTHLPTALRAGDLLVVNDSRTLPGAVDAVTAGNAIVRLHFSSALDDGTWAVEVRESPSAEGPLWGMPSGTRLQLPGHTDVTLLEPYPDPEATLTRLWRAEVLTADVTSYLTRFGRPISYAYLDGEWGLRYFQTMFATRDGSAEMPSAGRPFTRRVVNALAHAGITITSITLHAQVSSPDAGEPPLPERFAVSREAAEHINRAHAAGHRVVAVGTTVARALESACDATGVVKARRSWTTLVLGPERPARTVDGIITGWHAPTASHLDLVSAVVGAESLHRAYAEALDHGYLWHEFGDSSLLLRSRAM